MHSIPSERKARWVPWIFVGGMLVVVAVNGALIYFALSSWSGLAADHAYERGLAYNRALQATERQDALGWSLKALVRQDATGAELVVEAADRDARPLDGLAVDVALERPLGKSAARRMELRPAGAGRYSARLESLSRGQWDAQIAATSGADRMFATQRLTAP